MRILTTIMLLAAIPALSACGSANSNASAAAATKYETALKYSQCMRAHGVPSFPDPSSSGGLLLRAGPGTGIDPSSPAFKSAQQDCAKLQPNGGHPQALSATQREAALRFSRCMRSHGISAFPDPNFSGPRVQLQISKSSGIDPQSPGFQAAQKACGSQFGKAP